MKKQARRLLLAVFGLAGMTFAFYAAFSMLGLEGDAPEALTAGAVMVTVLLVLGTRR